MGKLVDADEVSKYVIIGKGDLKKCPAVEAIPKEQYESRLKAEKIAMLEELKKEIIELPFPQREPEYMQGYSYCQINILDYVIEEKINKLKENKS